MTALKAVRDFGRRLLYGRLRREGATSSYIALYTLGAYLYNVAVDLLNLRFPSLFVSERIIEIPFVHRKIDENCGAGSVAFEFGSVAWPYLSRKLREVQVCDWGYGDDPSDPITAPPNVKIMRSDFLQTELPANFFDAVISISTVEHVGLGGYGDPLHDEGDRRAVLALWRILKPGGILLLSVPFGRPVDTNWYRVYDSKRLNALLEGLQVSEQNFWVWKFPWWRRSTAQRAELADSTSPEQAHRTRSGAVTIVVAAKS